MDSELTQTDIDVLKFHPCQFNTAKPSMYLLAANYNTSTSMSLESFNHNLHEANLKAEKESFSSHTCYPNKQAPSFFLEAVTQISKLPVSAWRLHLDQQKWRRRGVVGQE
jgi:hypothetical protein